MDREELIRAMSEAESTDLAVLKQAAQNAKQAYLKNSTKANLESWKAAERAAEDYMAGKAEEQQGRDAASDARAAQAAAKRRVFENPKQAVDYLKAAGWQVSYNTLRKAVAKGLVKPRKGGGFSQWVLDQYGAACLKRRLDQGQAADAPEDKDPGLGEQKMAEEIALKQIVRQRETLKLARDRGALIPRELYEKDLAARLALFSNSLEAWFSRVAGEVAALLGADLEAAARIIGLVGGDPARALDLVGHVQACEPEILALLLARKHEWLRAFTLAEVQVLDIEPFLGLVRGEGGGA